MDLIPTASQLGSAEGRTKEQTVLSSLMPAAWFPAEHGKTTADCWLSNPTTLTSLVSASTTRSTVTTRQGEKKHTCKIFTIFTQWNLATSVDTGSLTEPLLLQRQCQGNFSRGWVGRALSTQHTDTITDQTELITVSNT